MRARPIPAAPLVLARKSLMHQHGKQAVRGRLGDAKLLGNIEIGHDSAIGANAVVVRSADAWTTLTGIPAEARPRRGAPFAERPDQADFYVI